VLLSDREAEHIAGCNMAWRREELEAIGGFDPQFSIAGDDVDACWRLQAQGGTIGYCAAAVVWHHRRGTISAYWRQQRNYGLAEALLERKWPEKFNEAGHLRWHGRIYGVGLPPALTRPSRVYHGTWGIAPFQRLYQSAPGALGMVVLMPEWYLVMAALAFLSALTPLWPRAAFVLAVLVLATCMAAVQAAAGARWALRTYPPHPLFGWFRFFALTSLLHALQPIARLVGRLKGGLTLWRRQSASGLELPRRWSTAVWTERWAPPESRLRFVDAALRVARMSVRYGGAFDRWDLEVPGGFLGGARLLMAVEDHGGGTQYVRVRAWPRFTLTGGAIAGALTALTGAAAYDSAWTATMVLAGVTLLVVGRMAWESAGAMASLMQAVRRLRVELTGTECAG
jgi:hypothetical protein